jgi:hypothetical protein
MVQGLRTSRRVAAGSIALLLVSGAAIAAETEARDVGGEAAHHRNEFATFIGATNVDGTQRPTLGFDYERRFTSLLGAGVLADWAFGGEGREFILAPAAFLHPLPEVRVTLAGGVQRNREEREIDGVVRVGAEYLIEAGERWSVAPGASVDFVAGETVTVLGVAVGYAF